MLRAVAYLRAWRALCAGYISRVSSRGAQRSVRSERAHGAACIAMQRSQHKTSCHTWGDRQPTPGYSRTSSLRASEQDRRETIEQRRREAEKESKVEGGAGGGGGGGGIEDRRRGETALDLTEKERKDEMLETE